MSNNNKRWIPVAIFLSVIFSVGYARADSILTSLGNEVLPGFESPNQCGSSGERLVSNLAVAIAEDIGRWDFVSDFQLIEAGTALALSDMGRAGCKGNCDGIEKILEKQFSGNVDERREYRASLVEAYKRQKSVERGERIPNYILERVGSEPGTCGELFWYTVINTECDSCVFGRADQLSRQLVFAGYPDNAYLDFRISEDSSGKFNPLVALDPSPGTVGGSDACSSSCSVIVSKGSVCGLYSSSNITSSCNCCICDPEPGERFYGKWKRSAFNRNYYVCTRG